jgi:ABC-type branched-subunit amino acid transport system permease subunit
MGRIWGNVIAAIVVTGMLEYLRILDEPINFLFIKTDDGLPGLRMVVFSILLMVIVIFRRPDRRFLEPAREKVAQSIKSLLTKKNGGTPNASN